MNYLIIVAAAVVLSAGTTVTDKFLLARVPVRGILAVISFFGFLSLALFPFTKAALPSPQQWMLGGFIGLILSVAIYTSFRALRVGEASRLAPLSVLSTAFITIGGVVIFNDVLGLKQILALFLFAIGSFLLATRMEKRIELFDPATWKSVSRSFARSTKRLVYNPARVGKQFTVFIADSIGEVQKILSTLSPDQLLQAKIKTKIKLVDGFWWYFASIMLLIPYTLLAKQLYSESGAIAGFVTIRTGMAIGCLILVLFGWRELKQFVKQPKYVAITSFKELFGAAAGFLTLYAFTLGPLGVVRSLLGLDAVLIFLFGTVLASIGLVEESIRRHALIQKGFGAAAMVSGTILLFL